MELWVLDNNLNAVNVLDDFESLIWTDRYSGFGDFELYTAMDSSILSYIKKDYYIKSSHSNHLMIVEKIAISADVEEGNKITVSGRSLESILDRRVIWKKTTISGTIQNGIKKLMYDNVINPSVESRKIDIIRWITNNDATLATYKAEGQYTGDNLYDVIKYICDLFDVGFKITWNQTAGKFDFMLYLGTDRSYDQSSNSYVIFSPSFENIVNSNYVDDSEYYKNVALIGGEDEGDIRKYAVVGTVSGIERREMFVDARDIQSEVDGETIDETTYFAQLAQRGKEKLAEVSKTTAFEGEVDATVMFKYGEDFTIGDIVQLANEYGHKTKARITEYVVSINENGISTYPTFTTITEESDS